MYLVYLDEFGHLGPFVSYDDPKYRESPVFGLAGFGLPADQTRGFGTWFYQRKLDLLGNQVGSLDRHPSEWERKGSKFFSVTNVTRNSGVRSMAYRLFNKIDGLGGFVFYVGVKKKNGKG